jgi:hypothetical protein
VASTSTTSVYLSQINEFFPIAGKDNDTQGFRNNFSNIKEALRYADKDIETLKLTTVKTTGTVNFNYNIIKKGVFQDYALYINDNASGSSISGDVIVNYKDGNYQKFAIDGGSHTFTVDPTSWPGSPSFPVQGEVILHITTSTNELTSVIFPGNYIEQGPTFSPYRIDQTGPQIFSVWNDGISTFVKPISNYKNVVANDTIQSDFVNVTDTLKIRNNSYTTGTNQETIVYCTATEQIGNLAILPNAASLTFGSAGTDYPGDDSATEFTIDGDSSLIKIGAQVYTPTVTSLSTSGSIVTDINGSVITVDPPFSVPGGWIAGDTVQFINPRFSEQPAVLRLTDKVAVNTSATVGDLVGEVYATTTTAYITVADYAENTVNKVQLLTSAGISNVLPTGLITLWYGSVATIPSGWALCNGSNGTPDLRDKFVVGAKQDDAGVAKTNITGSLTRTGGSLETLTTSTSTVGTAIVIPTSGWGSPGPAPGTISAGTLVVGSGTAESSETLESLSPAGGDRTLDPHSHTVNDHFHRTNPPPYFALCYIMKL